MANWKGTAVPNTGMVENVYFNTALSVEEVVGLLENLTLNYDGQGELLTASSLNEEGNAQLICILKMSETCWTIQSDTNSCSEVLFISSDVFDIGYVGWNPNITYPIVLGYELQSSLEDEDDEGNVGVVPIGTQNDLLSSLFSTTPFVEVQEKVTLNSFLTGIADAIRSKKGTTDKINASNFVSEIAGIQTGIEPSGTLDITENGTYDVKDYENANVNVSKYYYDTLTIEIASRVPINWEYEAVDVKPFYADYQNLTADDFYLDFCEVSIEITASGKGGTAYIEKKYNQSTGILQVKRGSLIFSGHLYKYCNVYLVVPTPNSYKNEHLTITENGTYRPNGTNKGYNQVTVNVPIPNGYIKPSGSVDITENGTHNVTNYESVDVNVPIPDGYIQPSGNIDITENGTYDVKDYENANVNVSKYYDTLTIEIASRVPINDQYKTVDVKPFYADYQNLTADDFYLDFCEVSIEINATGKGGTAYIEKKYNPSTGILQVKRGSLLFSGHLYKYCNVYLVVPTPNSYKNEHLTITENGTYRPNGTNKGYNQVTVNVPIPNGYIKPSGSVDITENGTHNVTNYESVNVNVPIQGGSGGGLDINGIIKEYQIFAGENINAGDFVEFVTGIHTNLNSEEYSCYENSLSCVLLENNKVFIAHTYTTNYYLYGTIVEIDGMLMTAKSTQLNTEKNSCYYSPSCVLLENNKVFIAHAYDKNRYLYGTIVEIDGTNMTAKSTQLNSTSKSCYYSPSCVLLENNKVFIAHAYDKNHYLYGTIVEIDGTNMTAKSTQLNSTSSSCSTSPSCILLENNRVFIAYGYTNSYYLYGTIVEIDGTNMTAKSTQLNSTSSSCYGCHCVLVENNKVFIAHAYDSNRYLYGTIVVIDGTNMTATSTSLNANVYSCYRSPSCILLENNRVFIAYGYNTGYYLYGTIVVIDGTNMTAKSTQLNTEKNSCYTAPSCVLLENNKVFISNAYTTKSYLYGTIAEIDGTTIPINTYVKPYETTIDGVAKESGTGFETIEIFVPNE